MEETTIQIIFTIDDINYLKIKFDIDDKEAFYQALWEMINTYMEM